MRLEAGQLWEDAMGRWIRIDRVTQSQVYFCYGVAPKGSLRRMTPALLRAAMEIEGPFHLVRPVERDLVYSALTTFLVATCPACDLPGDALMHQTHDGYMLCEWVCCDTVETVVNP
jgi:hypothetical protein